MADDDMTKPTTDPEVSGPGTPTTGPAHVDPGALALAVVVAASAFIVGSGTWNLLATLVGLFLLIVLLAYWRPAPPVSTIRGFAVKLGFGAGAALAICLALAPAIEWWIIAPSHFHTIDSCPGGLPVLSPEWHCEGPSYLDGNDVDAMNATKVIGWLWFPLVITITAFESQIMRQLDKRRREPPARP
jgi:hypothetical protein